ncbi:hypothetical protein M0R45_025841 [Rubus argutus]|uniref:Uncharacterized protein n=1 Tax=Rubus argutus TaxID=59490 RepID=A0AAW1WVR4_RUBAR
MVQTKRREVTRWGEGREVTGCGGEREPVLVLERHWRRRERVGERDQISGGLAGIGGCRGYRCSAVVELVALGAARAKINTCCGGDEKDIDAQALRENTSSGDAVLEVVRRWCGGKKHGGAKKLHGQSFIDVVRWLIDDGEIVGEDVRG